jgi:N-acetylmuramic acid 6-phosphate etherase
MICGSDTVVRLLGIEGTASATVALLADGQGRVLCRREAGPGHVKLLTDDQLLALFRDLSRSLAKPNALALGLAGASSRADRARVRSVAGKVWPAVPCHATSDFGIALAAAGATQGMSVARVVVVSGAGSVCFGEGRRGKSASIGGWGSWLGDKGSTYHIGLRALKAILHQYDQNGAWPKLGRRLLRTLQLNKPADLVCWVQTASPSEIRRLALEVLAAWRLDDPIASDIVAGAAGSLARDAEACARRISTQDEPVEFIFAVSEALRHSAFAARVNRELRKLRSRSCIRWLKRDTIWGAIDLAKQILHAGGDRAQTDATPSGPKRPVHPAPAVRSTRLSPTEQPHPLSLKLDQLPTRRAIELMLSEDGRISKRLLAERGRIEKAVAAIARAFRTGGRLIYVGAGTSGRLGVLDASECPPTFRSDPEMVQGIIAGGREALWQAVEGAEDDAEAGRFALAMRGVRARDIVVGIAASGTTPFVWGALNEATRRRATTILVCFNPYLAIPRGSRPTLVIAPSLGPELLTGSTRLKAGTATKLLLNIFSTLAMVRIGKVMGNLMVDLSPSNAKLRERATRIVQQLAGLDSLSARAALEQNQWMIKKAVSRPGRK